MQPGAGLGKAAGAGHGDKTLQLADGDIHKIKHIKLIETLNLINLMPGCTLGKL